jgi:urease accessory protein
MIDDDKSYRRRSMLKSSMKAAVMLLLLTTGSAAFAHTGHGVSGLAAGLAHPFLGLDHLLAMIAVGLWAAQGSGQRVWLLPAAFMAMLAAGGALAMLWQQTLPLIETAIALSVLALGMLIALTLKFSTAACMAITALFGLLHGYAHGLELPGSAAPAAYTLGFLIATAALHMAGLAAGVVTRERHVLFAKIAGGFIAMSGASLLTLS